MNIIMEGHHCQWLKVFRINGIDANINDFGKCYDDEREWAPDYGCGNMCFHQYDEPSVETLNKYSINIAEWKEICDKLNTELYVGRCADCE